MILLVNQAGTDAYNLASASALKVLDDKIILEQGNTVKVVAAYSNEDEAAEVFAAMLNDLADMDGLPFAGSEVKPYYLPE